VREVEKLMRDLDKPEKPVKQAPENDFIYRDLEDKFSKILGSQVAIKNKNNNKGKKENSIHLLRVYGIILYRFKQDCCPAVAFSFFYHFKST
jgi:hypothetical protein